jgi:UDP-N-acetyl-D-glucosamine dehydrogenase
MGGVQVTQPVVAVPLNGATWELEDTPSAVPTESAASRHGIMPIPGVFQSVAIVGMGYVGLPTALGLHESSLAVFGIDISGRRLEAIRSGGVDLLDADRQRLEKALGGDTFCLTTESTCLGLADAVIVCVPTPLDRHLTPHLDALVSACRSVVEQARAGQTIILTSTSFAGTTRELLIEPLEARGFTIGRDLYVAFSPERIDPGVPDHTQHATPRVVGGATARCTDKATHLLLHLTERVHAVSSPEAAELTKLYENTFRAVSLALANEFAEICGALSLDPIEVTLAAATKPYGFLATFPGPGVGGHCIPADPHYLLWQLRKVRRTAPVTEQAMMAIARRPKIVVDRAVDVLSAAGRGIRGVRVLVVGVAYKPGVQDLRESSALEILLELRRRGAEVAYHDPLVAQVKLLDNSRLESVAEPHGGEWDLVVMHTVHPGFDYEWATSCPLILDGTYRFDSAPHRALV